MRILTVVLIAACSGVPPHVVEPHDAGQDSGQPAKPDGGLDGGMDAGFDAGAVDAGPTCAGNTDVECGSTCRACSPIEHCMGGVCRFYNRVRFAYGWDDAGYPTCSTVERCTVTQDFAVPRALGIVEFYRDAGCATVTVAGDGVSVADRYDVDCVVPYCRPLNPSSNCCRTFAPGGAVGACLWTPP